MSESILWGLVIGGMLGGIVAVVKIALDLFQERYY